RSSRPGCADRRAATRAVPARASPPPPGAGRGAAPRPCPPPRGTARAFAGTTRSRRRASRPPPRPRPPLPRPRPRSAPARSRDTSRAWASWGHLGGCGGSIVQPPTDLLERLEHVRAGALARTVEAPSDRIVIELVELSHDEGQPLLRRQRAHDRVDPG